MKNTILFPKRYVVKPNDNLSNIAKKFGYSSWKTIYFSKFNSDLRRLRPDPDKILPKDNISLPPNAQDVVSALMRSNTILQQTKQDFIKDTESEMIGLKQELVKLKNISNEIDAVKDVIFIVKDLSKIVFKGIKAVKLSGKDLKKMNDELAKDTIDFSYNSIKEKGLEIYSEADLDKNIVTVTSQIIVGYYVNMTSPSFWANYISNLMNGMSWIEAFKSKPEHTLEKCFQEIRNQRDKIINGIDKRIHENKKLILEFSKSGGVDKPLPIKVH